MGNDSAWAVVLAQLMQQRVASEKKMSDMHARVAGHCVVGASDLSMGFFSNVLQVSPNT